MTTTTVPAIADPSLTSGAFRLLTALRSLADADGNVHLSYDDLAASCGVSRATVARAIPTLVASGYAVVDAGRMRDSYGVFASKTVRLVR